MPSASRRPTPRRAAGDGCEVAKPAHGGEHLSAAERAAATVPGPAQATPLRRRRRRDDPGRRPGYAAPWMELAPACARAGAPESGSSVGTRREEWRWRKPRGSGRSAAPTASTRTRADDHRYEQATATERRTRLGETSESRNAHDPIERWEWEGGAIAADVRSASDEAAASDQPSSSTTSSRRRPPGASASTTSPTRRPSRAAPIGDSCEISPAVGSLSPVPTTR